VKTTKEIRERDPFSSRDSETDRQDTTVVLTSCQTELHICTNCTYPLPIPINFIPIPTRPHKVFFLTQIQPALDVNPHLITSAKEVMFSHVSVCLSVTSDAARKLCDRDNLFVCLSLCASVTIIHIQNVIKMTTKLIKMTVIQYSAWL